MSSPFYERRPERVQAMQLNGPASYPAIVDWVRSLGGKATAHDTPRLTLDGPCGVSPGGNEYVVYRGSAESSWFEVWSARDFEAAFDRA